jgi:hypothetical protein
MRMPPFSPRDFTSEQQPLYNDMYRVGLYSMVSTTLNGFNVPVPERE